MRTIIIAFAIQFGFISMFLFSISSSTRCAVSVADLGIEEVARCYNP